MHLRTSSRETDSGATLRYYTATLNSKNSILMVQEGILQATFTQVQELICTLSQNTLWSQQDLQFNETTKLTCMPHSWCELANCPAILKAPLSVAFLPLKMAAVYQISIHFVSELCLLEGCCGGDKV